MAALIALIASALAAAVAPPADAKKRKKKAPVITSVSPMDVAVGETLTIRGKNFIRGRGRNTVVFKRDGARAVFVKADVATRKLLRLDVPDSLQEFFSLSAGNPLPTKFRLRVLAKKFGKKFTPDQLSPVVFAPRPAAAAAPGAAAAPAAPGTPAPAPPVDVPDGDCDGDGVKNGADDDDDNDGLTDAVEVSLSLNPCVADTDQDGVLDKWEFDCDGDGATNGVDGDDDNDGLTDAVEISLSLNPCAADSDQDGVLDKWEFDCDRNGVLNRDEDDDDKDLLADGTETQIGTDPCALDSDGDGVEDGFEYQSAKDLNDDEHQDPNDVLPFPGKRPYPNPLFADSNLDYDGDSLTLADEQMLWKYTYTSNHTASRTLQPLSYSDGMQYSLFRYVSDTNRRRVPNQPFSTYTMQQQFLNWASGHGYGSVYLSTGMAFDAPVNAVDGLYELRDVNLDGTVDPSETNLSDYDRNGYVGDAERDEDADGLSNYVEVRGMMRPNYWSACYGIEGAFPIPYAGTRADDPDSDGDGVLDGADDQDHDDVPNLMELSRMASSGYDDREGRVNCKVDADLLVPKDLDGDGEPDDEVLNHDGAYGRVNPFNPCLPFVDSRTCPRFHEIDGDPFAPFDLSVNWISTQ